MRKVYEVKLGIWCYRMLLSVLNLTLFASLISVIVDLCGGIKFAQYLRKKDTATCCYCHKCHKSVIDNHIKGIFSSASE